MQAFPLSISNKLIPSQEGVSNSGGSQGWLQGDRLRIELLNPRSGDKSVITITSHNLNASKPMKLLPRFNGPNTNQKASPDIRASFTVGSFPVPERLSGLEGASAWQSVEFLA